MDTIRSRSNSKIQQARALRQRRLRDESGTYLAEGIHLVGAAVESGVRIEAIFYAPDLLKSQYALDLIAKAGSEGVPCYPTTADVFTSLSAKEHPQGIVAVVRQPVEQLSTLDAETFPWGVACLVPQDPGNVGSILRTIDAVGASGIILLDGGVDAYHPTAVRASMGAVFRHPVVSSSFHEFAVWVEDNDYKVIGTSAHAEQEYQETTHFAKPLVLLLGDERRGLNSEHIAVCDTLLRLPMHGRVTSLNLAVAAGIMLYDILQKVDWGGN